MLRRLALTTALFLLLPAAARAAPVTFEAAGANAAAIQPTVDAFRTALGPQNPNTAGSKGTGRREINWDGVPEAASSPNSLPADFFNVTSPRGVVFSTPGTGFRVSANGPSPTEFADIDPSYPGTFGVLSPQKLFSPSAATVTDVTIFVPGSTTHAVTNGFGVVFTDVDTAGGAKLQFFDADGTSIYSRNALTSPGSQGLSFLGALLPDGPGIARVRITSGTAAIATGVLDGGAERPGRARRLHLRRAHRERRRTGRRATATHRHGWRWARGHGRQLPARCEPRSGGRRPRRAWRPL